MKKFLKFMFVLILIGVFCATFFGYQWYSSGTTKTFHNEDVTITIPMGSSTSKIASILKEKDIIKNEDLFKWKVKQSGLANSFKAGEYNIPTQQPLDMLLQRFAEGDVVEIETVKVTFQEGLTLEQIAEKVDSSGLATKEEFLNVAHNWSGEEWFLQGTNIDQYRLEGFLYPETYEFTLDSTSEDIINKMLKEFDKRVSKYKLQMQEHELGIRGVMTVASLIEKEARHDEDRGKIAGVIYNRIDQDMRLGIDASVLYVVGHKEEITKDDLNIDSPFNTRKYKGLPPSPISTSSEASVEAALYPVEHDYIFYVADRDTGYHHFAVTYKEHQENTEKYWKN